VDGVHQLIESLRAMVVDPELKPTGQYAIDGPDGAWLFGFQELNGFTCSQGFQNLIYAPLNIYFKHPQTAAAIPLSDKQRCVLVHVSHYCTMY
jgi:hypothetical protein